MICYLSSESTSSALMPYCVIRYRQYTYVRCYNINTCFQNKHLSHRNRSAAVMQYNNRHHQDATHAWNIMGDEFILNSNFKVVDYLGAGM